MPLEAPNTLFCPGRENYHVIAIKRMAFWAELSPKTVARISLGMFSRSKLLQMVRVNTVSMVTLMVQLHTISWFVNYKPVRNTVCL